MLPPPSDSQSTGSSVALGGAALAAGAMLAGFALHRKTSLPLAAGLAAAAASLRLITKSKGEDSNQEEVFSEPPAREGFRPCPESKFQVLDEDALEDEEAADWVNSDAVLFEHVVPAGSPAPPPPAQQTLAAPPSPQATSFPLLDDDGNPVVSLPTLPPSWSPAIVEASDEFGFPLGPLIWEPDESNQHCLESEGDTLWFSASDIVQPPVPPAWTSSAPPVLLANTIAPAVVAPAVIAPAHVPGAPSSPESVSSILESLRAEAAAREGVLPEDTPSLPELAVPIAKGPDSQAPLSFADWMLSTQTPSAVTPLPTEGVTRMPIRTALPTPRQPGEAPRSETEDPYTFSGHIPPPPVEGVGKHPSMSRGSREERAPVSQPPSPALVYHRSVAPLAPVILEEPPYTRSPLTMILVALILTVVLLAVAIWGDGQLPDKAATPPWSQEHIPVEERVTTATPLDL